jgi:hypothetical protein
MRILGRNKYRSSCRPHPLVTDRILLSLLWRWVKLEVSKCLQSFAFLGAFAITQTKQNNDSEINKLDILVSLISIITLHFKCLRVCKSSMHVNYLLIRFIQHFKDHELVWNSLPQEGQLVTRPVLGQFPLELYDSVTWLVLCRNDVVSSWGCLRERLIN